MLPGGAVAALFLLSLIPGWFFLRRTESARRPRQLSTLQEMLELVGVGLVTTGLALAALLLLFPNVVLDRTLPPDSARELRLEVGLTLGLLASAILLAEIAARWLLKRHTAPASEFTVGVWWSVLRAQKVPDGQLPYVALALTDGTTVDGVLHDYTWMPDVTHRDIALRKPITFTSAGTKKKPPYDYLVVPEDKIQHIALKYVPR